MKKVTMWKTTCYDEFCEIAHVFYSITKEEAYKAGEMFMRSMDGEAGFGVSQVAFDSVVAKAEKRAKAIDNWQYVPKGLGCAGEYRLNGWTVFCL